jgi:RNA polymerase sigma-70 factor (ECF subfamily)
VKASHYTHLTDSQLLENYYSGKDQQWIGILLERYTLLLLGVCMKYIKNEEEAKDCVQQIFLKVLTEVAKYRIEFFKSWLYMVAKNHCLMKLRNKHGHKTGELNEEIAEIKAENNHWDSLSNEQTYSLLDEAINELNNEQRLCIDLFYLQKNSYQQVAGKTGYSAMQVKSFIQNGKRNLRLILERKLKRKNASF